MGNVLNLTNDLQVDKKLKRIWSEYFDKDSKVIAPLYHGRMKKNTVIFLSLNPSLQAKDVKDATLGFYPHPPYFINTDLGKAEYIFFQKFYDLGKEIKQPWTIMDLLYERESIQQEIENKYNPSKITEKDKSFLQNQIKLTFEILESLNPKVVVVSNRGAERLIHSNLKELGLRQELPNKENGFIYRINKIPFITNESCFMGSRQHYNQAKKDGRMEKLTDEILRVINY